MKLYQLENIDDVIVTVILSLIKLLVEFNWQNVPGKLATTVVKNTITKFIDLSIEFLLSILKPASNLADQKVNVDF